MKNTKKFSTALLIIAALVLPRFVSASETECMVEAIEAGKKLGVGLFTQNFSGKTFRGIDLKTGNKVKFTFGKRFGFGMTASVYPFKDFQGLPQIAEAGPAGFVGKVPHVFKALGIEVPGMEGQVLDELKIIEGYKKDLAEVDRNWQQDHPDGREPAWGYQGLPGPDITAVLKTKHFELIVKPALKGRSMNDIADELKPKNISDLPPEMQQSLKDVYDYYQASLKSTHLKMPGENEADHKPFSLDINPSNLIWIDDPALMKTLGLSRPSFYFYEIGHRLRTVPDYESFQGEVLSYLKIEEAHKLPP